MIVNGEFDIIVTNVVEGRAEVQELSFIVQEIDPHAFAVSVFVK